MKLIKYLILVLMCSMPFACATYPAVDTIDVTKFVTVVKLLVDRLDVIESKLNIEVPSSHKIEITLPEIKPEINSNVTSN